MALYKLGLRSDVKVKTKITINMQVSIIFSFKEASFYIDQKIREYLHINT